MKNRLFNILIPASRKNRMRLITGFLCVDVLICGYFWYTHWTPDHKLESEHYVALSSVTVEDTRDALERAEALYRAYTDFWGINEAPREKLLLKIYASRKEFKRANPMSGWAEAFYQEPYCHQYIESGNKNRPYHWMVHEATHQLNNEVSHFKLPQWAEEGLACYFGSSRMEEGKIEPGVIDRETYPAWWLDSLGLSGDISQDKAHQKIMSIKSVVNNDRPLNMDEHFNLYYIHWFSLVHFLLEGQQGKYREAFISSVNATSGSGDFEKSIGPFDEIEPQWYQHLCWMIDNL